MSLSHAYAQILREKGGEKSFVKKLVSFMKARGHQSLLPEIVRILERAPRDKGAVVVIAKESDRNRFAKEIRKSLDTLGEGSATTLVDSKIVGGYSVQVRSTLIDRTFRKALVSIYQKTIAH